MNPTSLRRDELRGPSIVLALVLGCAEPHGGAAREQPLASAPDAGEPAGRERQATQAAALVLDFDHTGVGTLPAGWRIGATNPRAPLASWSVVADPGAPTPPNALALVSSTHGSSDTFNLCWTDSLRFQDGALELAFKAEGGEEDQGGGPIWRVLDEDNYYVCRMNPRESNFRLYCVQDGRRKELASARVEVARGTWHKIRVEHAGPRIVCTLDGGTPLEASDDHVPQAGGVGLWTKADAATSFDDFVVHPAGKRATLVPAGTIDLPGVEGRIDHLAIDLARQRLFVAALGNDSVEVLDLQAGAVARSLPASEPQGILYLSDCDRMIVANGRAGTCEVFAGDTLERVATVEVGDDPDNLRYDPRTKRVYVAYGEGALGILHAEAWKLVDLIPLAGHPESFQLDATGRRAFANVPDARQVARLDLEQRVVLGTWSIDEARANFPMAWMPGADPSSEGFLLIGCRAPAKLVVRAVASGERVGLLELAGDTDDVFYDAARRRVYVACGEGSLDVFERDEHDRLRALDTIPTAPGARTCLFVPERGQLFVAVPRRGTQRAEVRIFRAVD